MTEITRPFSRDAKRSVCARRAYGRPALRFASRLNAIVFAICICATGAFASNQFLLITSELQSQPIHLLSVDEQRLHYTDLAGDRELSLPLDMCIAILKEQPAKTAATAPGLLRLADGRQFPGEPASPRRTEPRDSNEHFAWHSSWLGRVDVRLDEIESVLLKPAGGGGNSRLAHGNDATRRSDMLTLTNGDILEGFIAQIRDRIVLEVDEGARTIEVPLDRVASVRMIAPPREPSNDRRAWLADGTIMSVSRIEVDEGGMARLAADGLTGGTRLDVRHVSAVLLAPGRMVPLSSLKPASVSGPETRYVIPQPRATDDDALLGLSHIELHGPIRVEYELPGRANRFAAEVILPESSRHYGDFDLIIRDGEREVYRARLNAANPVADINVPLTGATFTIELAEGPHGAIHNHVVLNRAMLRVD